MATRKQRRRRAKEHRHEYVWEDDEGNELDSDEVPTHRSDGRSPQRRSAAAGRQVQPPSWRRTFKRALIFAPIMLVTVMLLSSDLSLAQQVVQAAFIVAIFIPFSYFLDGVFWRSYQKRVAREQAGRGRSG
jgi:hypothetical protein